MSRIKNNICHINTCDFKNKKSNIIIFHANEYGNAVKSRCKEFFELEMRDIYKTTNTNLTTLELEESIGFYSFTYKDKNFIYDFIEDDSFEKYIKRWEEEKSTNYFFFIGYHPNVSNMVDLISPYIENVLNDYCFLFSSPMSMDRWRKETCESIKKYNLLNTDNYYLSVDSHDKDNKYISIEGIKNSYANYKVKKISNRNILKDIPFNELFNVENETRDIHFIDLVKNNRINEFKKNNFISNFAKLGINVVREYIQTENSLLMCKQQVFEKEGISLKLLINGDSINNFQINLINCDKILKENKGKS